MEKPRSALSARSTLVGEAEQTQEDSHESPRDRGRPDPRGHADHGLRQPASIALLESRFDNVVFRLGFVTSRNEGRLLIGQGHFKVNGRRVDIPSAQIRTGDEVGLTERGKKAARIEGALQALETRTLPTWLETDPENKIGKMISAPVREEITLPIQEQLIIELYSR